MYRYILQRFGVVDGSFLTVVTALVICPVQTNKLPCLSFFARKYCPPESSHSIALVHGWQVCLFFGSRRYTLLCFLSIVLSDALMGHSLGQYTVNFTSISLLFIASLVTVIPFFMSLVSMGSYGLPTCVCALLFQLHGSLACLHIHTLHKKSNSQFRIVANHFN